MSVSDTLNAAADLIEQHGWGGDWYAEEGAPVCVEGALLAAVGMKADDRWRRLDDGEPVFYTCPAYLAVTDYLAGRLTDHIDPLWRWNDTEGRTQAEVVEVLRAAAIIEAAKLVDASLVTAGGSRPVPFEVTR